MPPTPRTTSTATPARASNEIGNTSAADAVVPRVGKRAATTQPSSGSAKKVPKAAKQFTKDISALLALLPETSKDDTVGERKKKEDIIEFVIKLATHQQGVKKGQFSGRAFACINCVYAENEALKKLVERILHAKVTFFAAWKKWAVRAPTRELALKLFDGIKEDPKLALTARRMNAKLDLSCAVTSLEPIPRIGRCSAHPSRRVCACATGSTTTRR